MPTPQIATKTCKQCGTENDLILSNCKSCNTSLHRIGLDTIPEEILLNNCAIWLARMEAINDVRSLAYAKMYDSMLSHEKEAPPADRIPGSVGNFLHGWSAIRVQQANQRAGKSLSEITGNVDRYIRTLETRAQTNPELAGQIADLKIRQAAARQNLEKIGNEKVSINRIGLILCFLGLLSIPLGVLGFRFIRESSEEKRLSSLVEKAEQTLIKGDKAAARFIVSQIKWSVSDLDNNINQAKAKAWDDRREALLKTLSE